MPRTARASKGGYCYHVLNRGNRRAEVFHRASDYQAFLDLIVEAGRQVAMRVLAYCLMPNHFHLVVWPLGDGDLSRWMQWLLTAHVGRYQRHYHSTGHVWQGRFKAFAVADDEHLLTVLRYVERNPVRAGLAKRAQDWPWSSAGLWQGPEPPLGLPVTGTNDLFEASRLAPGPVPRGPDWLGHVNRELHEADLKRVRHSVRREAPYGAESWVRATAAALGLESTLRSRGRPRLHGRDRRAECIGDGGLFEK